jgi:hypothetical protein
MVLRLTIATFFRAEASALRFIPPFGAPLAALSGWLSKHPAQGLRPKLYPTGQRPGVALVIHNKPSADRSQQFIQRTLSALRIERVDVSRAQGDRRSNNMNGIFNVIEVFLPAKAWQNLLSKTMGQYHD